MMLLGIILLPKTLYTQEEFVAPSAKYITSIPFKILTGGIIIVNAKFDDKDDTLHFVFDTGSGGISLDSATTDKLKIPRVKSDKIVKGIAGNIQVDFAYDHTLHFYGLSVEHLDFHINNYDILTASYGIRIDGIIGYSFLRRYIVMINYDKHMMDIYSPGALDYPKGGYVLKPQFSTLARLDVNIQDNNRILTKYYFDTGAGLCMLLSEDLVQDSALFKKRRKFYPTQAEGLGGKKTMYLTYIKDIKVGPYRFKDVPVYVFDDTYKVTSYPQTGGLIGNDILRRFNIILNYPKQEIFIKPNKNFSDSFDYSYTGLGIYLINGAITITDIMKGSPAEKAGFKIGDVILGVGSNFSNNILAYKTLLQSARARLNIVIMREGDLMEIKLKVKSIY
ncbi:MAG: aspartyl protease family protein [Bacteroidetes bacterium]|nr:aspartyl protease family protein [Bacteroidota bacterium]